MKPLPRVEKKKKKKKKTDFVPSWDGLTRNKKNHFLLGLAHCFITDLLLLACFPRCDFISEIKLQSENKEVMILWITIIRNGYLISDSSGQSKARFVDALDNRISKERFTSIEDLERYSHVSAV